jgi:hypothetical protein
MCVRAAFKVRVDDTRRVEDWEKWHWVRNQRRRIPLCSIIAILLAVKEFEESIQSNQDRLEEVSLHASGKIAALLLLSQRLKLRGTAAHGQDAHATWGEAARRETGGKLLASWHSSQF